MYAISIDEDQERRVREIEGTFETEYAIDDSQVIRFPVTMGVNGYCFKRDAIAYFNHLESLSSGKKIYPNLFCLGERRIQFDA